jgi:signal transduction histidine kinase
MLSTEYLHDLRTPLNQIIGYSEMLVEQAEEEGQTGFVPDLQKIHTAGRQLLALLNNGGGGGVLPSGPDAAPAGMSLDYGQRAAAVTLPPAAETTELSATSATQTLILVVDDNEVNRDVLARPLKRQGYNVATVENGRQAMDALRDQAFDLVLLDIMMPEIDGYAVLQQIKADDTLCHIPVIMISALDDMNSVVRCIEMGAEDYLSKPFDPTLLKARIGSCLEKKRARDLEVRFTAELERSYRKLQELEKLRDDLTRMIIHDLRTPLTSVILGMQTLEIAGELNEDQRDLMDIAVAGGQTLLGMINDLLDVEKLESGTMQLDYSVLSAAELVTSAISQVASLAQSKKLTVVQQIAADLPPLHGDAGKLLRTLVNLLGNAIKFTPSGGAVTVEARPGEDEKTVVFSVRDTGEGIPSDAFERIFEKFGQVESRKGGRTMSTGLGLTFCKLAVEAHGGHIGVESLPGQGSKFSFTIPLGALQEELPAAGSGNSV